MIPLIATQLVSVYIWVCIGCLQVGFYREVTSGQQQLKGPYGYYIKNSILNNSIYLDPLSVFLYTWQLIPLQQSEAKNTFLATTLRYYYKYSIYIVPVEVLLLYFSYSVC